MIGTGRTIGAHPRSRLARLGHGIWRLGFARPQPWTTWTLAAIVVGFFAVELHLGDPEQEIFLLHRLGSLRAPLLWAGDWHRLATSVFLHAGWTHFLMNLFGLFLFGFFVERRIGSRRTALLFATSALVGNAVFVQRRPWEYCVGASGALYGMVAVFVAYDSGLHARRPGELLFDRRFWFVSLMLFAFDVGAAEGLSLPIAPEAHWAGYGAGIAFGWLVLSEGRPRLRRVARAVAGIAFAASLALAIRPVYLPGYRLWVADRTFVTEDSRAGLAAYLELHERGVEGSGLRVALAEYETSGPVPALERLDALPEEERSSIAGRYLRIAALDDLARKPEADAAFDELLAEMEEAVGEGPWLDNAFAMACADHRRQLPEAHVRMYRLLLSDPALDPEKIDTIGWVELVSGEREDGLLALQASWAMYPEAAIAYHLSEAHAQLDDVARAREFLALAFDPKRNLQLGMPGSNLLDVVRARRLGARLAARPVSATKVDELSASR